MNTNVLDTQKVEAFGERMVDLINEGALALMCSIGHRTGLFDTLAMLPPATSAQIAEASGLNERYVREWLSAMVVGRILEYDPAAETYYLPMEYAGLLTHAAGAENMAIYTQYIGVLAGVEEKIVRCFRNGGGVSYSSYPGFHEVMAEDSYANVVEPLLEQILPIVPGLTERLRGGIDVLDVGCGRGHALKRLARTFPDSRFSGFDLSEAAIAFARADVVKMRLDNLRFDVKDAAALNEQDRYDLITTFDAIHDQAHPAQVLRNIFHALKPGGVYLMQDIAASSNLEQNLDNPLAPLLYTISTMHCMTVSLAYGGEGLGTMWGKDKALELLTQAGFSHTEVHQLPHDEFSYYYISTKQ